jgi:ABC-type transport system involved in cytochrome c biogenesis permease subunit
VELAVIDPSDPETDDVVVVPGSVLRKGGVVRHGLLPFDVEVHRYMVNSKLADAGPGDADNPATAGNGRRFVAVEEPENSGVAVNAGYDLPSAYVTFKKKGTGEVLGGGTYLVSLWYSLLDRLDPPLAPQQVEVGGKKYEVALRFKRTYKPYTVSLKKFTHDVYPGTTKPKDFRSDVRLVDPTRGEEREVEIYMNHPLRYRGETFYQSSFLENDAGTVLQVVRNPGWLLPYFSCVLVSLGMLVHFGINLTSFLLRKLAAGGFQTGATGFGRYVPWGVVGVAALFLVGVMVPPADPAGQMHFHEVGNLPVQEGGRVKPLDTFARNTLMAISGRQDFTDEDGKTQPAVKWVLDVMTSRISKSGVAERHKVVRIDNEEVLDLLGLKARSGFRYAVGEFADKIERLEKQAARSRNVPQGKRELFDVKVLEVAERLQLYVDVARMQTPQAVPPEAPGGEWEPLAQAMAEMKDGRDRPAARGLGAVLLAYAEGKPEAFNRELDAYSRQVDGLRPEESSLAGFEVFFNDFKPFIWCCFLYVLVFLLVCAAWLSGEWSLNRAAFWLALLTLVVHTWALGARMYIQGRPPVTNLYSSAVFIGWAAVVLGLVLEAIFRIGFGNVVAAAIGALTVLIAHHLARSGDTMQMMEAVLDTNFWLATHVVCVTIGYAATFFAGFLGFLYIGCWTFLRARDDLVLKVLGQMLYAIVCFATLFSFVGTVLGGIWADQSWGRFWGWDPKENGALLIVIWNALILHARWGGLVKGPGVAALAVVGNMITGWSWFGTNQLGVGLHAYGFNNTLALGLVVWWGINVAVLVALLVVRFTRLGSPAPAFVTPQPSGPVESPTPRPRRRRRN